MNWNLLLKNPLKMLNRVIDYRFSNNCSYLVVHQLSPIPNQLLSVLVNLTPRAFAVILEHFDQVVGDCFMDCVNCLIRFANNKTSHRISLKAIALLRICEDRLAEVHVEFQLLMIKHADMSHFYSTTLIFSAGVHSHSRINNPSNLLNIFLDTFFACAK